MQDHNNTDEHGAIRLETHEYVWDEDGRARPRTMGLYLCQLCRKGFARWPSERAFRRMLLGVSITFVFRTPYACSNCRIFRLPQVAALGVSPARRFWNRVLGWFS